MTREEAIARINDHKIAHKMNEPRAIYISEALEMAIEALKEPCEQIKWERDTALAQLKELGYGLGEKIRTDEDTISRQAYIERYRKWGYSEFGRKVDNEALAIRVAMSLPPVTPKHKWIPVDYDRYPETYPKAFQEVWITDAYGEVYHKTYDGTRNIKAWMPYVIPEPYKEGESE